MKSIKYGAALLLMLSVNAFAYKQPVHMKMTDYAVSRSVLAGDDLWRQWNISKAGSFHYQPAQVDFHLQQKETMNYMELFSYGVDSEDTSEGIRENNYQLGWSRAFNHFYNPQADKKLDLGGQYVNWTSLQWALESAAGTPSVVSINYQRFSFADAQYYFYLAFASSTADKRDLYMGMMFQSLGNVVHHIQDMAQPEHTRLDAHCDASICKTLYKLTGDDTSLYEEFTEELLSCGGGEGGIVTTPIAANDTRVKCDNLQSWGGPFVTNKVYLGNYTIPEFNLPYQFWHTSDNKGMADFSSRNFITTDTPYQLKAATPGSKLIDRLLPYGNDLPYPSGAVPDTYVTSVSLKDLLPDGLGKIDAYKNHRISFLGLHTTDALIGQPVDIPRMASFSIFTERLNLSGGTFLNPTMMFSTNYFNLEQWAATLLPRAVAYSTGLINHFFKIRLGISSNRVWASPNTINIKNNSSYGFQGRLEFYYDNEYGSRVFHSATDTFFFEAGKTITSYRLEVPLSKKPTTHFYVIAVDAFTGGAAAVTAFEHDAKIPDDKAPQPCDKGISNTGGYETFETTINMGDKAGVANLFYEMYQIPDSIFVSKISGPNARIYATWTPVSGKATIPIQYDPALFPQHAISVLIQGGQPGTAWYIKVECPK